VGPVSTAIAGSTGFAANYDFANLATTYPNWPGLFELLSGSFPEIGFIASAPVAFLSAGYLSRRQPTISGLLQERDDLKVKSEKIGETVLILFDGILLNLARKLNYENDSTVRLSIYLHVDSQRCFIPCGRYSINPVLQKKGRTKFPDSQGCIAKAWQNGWHFDNAFPENPSERQKYNTRSYGIPDSECRGLKMAARVMCAMRIVDFDHRSLGVIVLESTQGSRFVEEEVKALMADEAVSVGKMLSDLRSHIPSPQDASSRGL
jgi:hypothetical protein